MAKKKAKSQSDAAPATTGDAFPPECYKEGGKLVKIKAVEWFLTHNPDMGDKAASEALTKLGCDMSPPQLANYRSIIKKKKSGGAAPKQKRGKGKAAHTQNGMAGFPLIQSAAAFIRAAGGITQAQQALTELSNLPK